MSIKGLDVNSNDTPRQSLLEIIKMHREVTKDYRTLLTVEDEEADTIYRFAVRDADIEIPSKQKYTLIRVENIEYQNEPATAVYFE